MEVIVSYYRQTWNNKNATGNYHSKQNKNKLLPALVLFSNLDAKIVVATSWRNGSGLLWR